MRVGHGVVCVPFTFHHPDRVAQRTAMLDLLSGGRLDLGAGRRRAGGRRGPAHHCPRLFLACSRTETPLAGGRTRHRRTGDGLRGDRGDRRDETNVRRRDRGPHRRAPGVERRQRPLLRALPDDRARRPGDGAGVRPRPPRSMLDSHTAPRGGRSAERCGRSDRLNRDGQEKQR
ncbi:hypothetical protein [Streptomyces huasconensis]|uniref:hypothetical protein n=1 Tax=Streptomyces huasconensis TaxID=1854574 RepID=UPI002E7B232C|nr:hypothetical protein [Streptomyces huasconensis]